MVVADPVDDIVAVSAGLALALAMAPIAAIIVIY